MRLDRRRAVIMSCVLALGVQVAYSQDSEVRGVERVPRPIEGAEAGSSAGSERAVLGRPTGFAHKSAETFVLEPGVSLRVGPAATADTLAKVPVAPLQDRTAEVVERRETQSGEWLRLRWGGLLGWFNAKPESISDEGALAVLSQPSRLERRKDLAALARLAVQQGREHRWTLNLPVLAGPAQPREIAVWSGLERKSLRGLQQLTECLGQLYTDRFGLMEAPPELALEMVVFPDRGSYEQFIARSTVVVGAETSGIELDGLILVAADPVMEVGFLGTVAHELTHALNRLAFPANNLLPWVEEGMAEDVAHSVEAAFVQSRRPCGVPGGWSRTQVRDAVVMEDAQALKEKHLTRSPRARSLLCYPGPEGVADLLAADRSEFGVAIDRRWKYVEALLLVRTLLERADQMSISRRSLLLAPIVEEAELDVVRSLADLPWRVTERELMDC